jgi:hypothetical protein
MRRIGLQERPHTILESDNRSEIRTPSDRSQTVDYRSGLGAVSFERRLSTVRRVYIDTCRIILAALAIEFLIIVVQIRQFR